MKLFNTLSKSKEDFRPVEINKVQMYVCGITPYDTTHLGHAFTYLSFDVLIRYLRYKGFSVNYTQNVTDINDRDNDILKRAEEQKTAWQNLSKFWTEKFLSDMHELNWIMPDNFLFASKNIKPIVDIIGKLLKNGLAYQIKGGVYMDVSKSNDFGKLSGFDESKMLELAKGFDEDIENPDKKHPLDITLWRPTIPDQSSHIPSFDSPFGLGRPGWHIECSAMAISSLGEQIDIHGGGSDLIFPHHESEITQSEGATGKMPFAKFWIHTGAVSYKGQKMSKSIGNLVLISDLLKKYSANAIRYMLLSHHYREPWEFHEKEMVAAEEKINELKRNLNVYSSSERSESRSFDKNSSRQAQTINDGSIREFDSAMDDDLNTPKAIEIMLKAENKEEVKLVTDILGFKNLTPKP